MKKNEFRLYKDFLKMLNSKNIEISLQDSEGNSIKNSIKSSTPIFQVIINSLFVNATKGGTLGVASTKLILDFLRYCQELEYKYEQLESQNGTIVPLLAAFKNYEDSITQ